MLRKYWPFAAVILAALLFFHFHHSEPTVVFASFVFGILTGAILVSNDPLQDARTHEELDKEWNILVASYNAAKARLTKYV